MESQKSRRKSKWLSKVFHREDSTGSQTSTSTIESRPAPSQASQTGLHTSSESLPPSNDTIDKNSEDTLYLKEESLTLQDRKLPEEHRVNVPDQKIENGHVHRPILEALADTVTPLNTPNVLIAPKVINEKSQGSSSPYKEIQQAEKLPHLLDPDISMRNAKLWEKAYSQLTKDPKTKDLIEKYEAILDEDVPQQNVKSSFPKKMEASVEQQVLAMKQKQWVLQWDQKSIVIRDQAERIVKFVQTFSSLGTAIAQIDPIHVGIPCKSPIFSTEYAIPVKHTSHSIVTLSKPLVILKAQSLKHNIPPIF
jgi:hypothetical protein